MDGIDGLVAGCNMYTWNFIIFGNYELTYLIGALIGFLIINWSPAKFLWEMWGALFLGLYL